MEIDLAVAAAVEISEEEIMEEEAMGRKTTEFKIL
jgi:hypothetical protein